MSEERKLYLTIRASELCDQLHSKSSTPEERQQADQQLDHILAEIKLYN